jgi:pimeloyl-ACP methyl ester carboxylesterase
MLMFGEKELVYGDLQGVMQAGRELLPSAKLAVIPQAHHIAALSNPDVANDELLRFFAEG